MQAERFVYVASDGHGHHKVGITDNLPLRQYHLRRDTGVAVEIIHATDREPLADAIEVAAHHRLADRHLDGEWFAVDAEAARAAVDAARLEVIAGHRPAERLVKTGQPHKRLGLVGLSFLERLAYLARVKAILHDGENVADLIREAVRKEIEAREKAR